MTQISPIPHNSEWRHAAALVTDANRGIGFEIARGLGQMGIVVLLGCRNPALGKKAAERLQGEGLRAEVVFLDVTDPAMSQAAAKDIAARFGRLDILVNNAGILLERGVKPSTVDLAVVRRIYDVNVFGVMAITQAMLPLLAKSPRGRIVNVSSTLGSLTQAAQANSPSSGFVLLGYCSSKTALNSVTVQFANELRCTGIKVNAACPGYCATDLNGHAGPRSAKQGAQTPIRLATLPNDGPTGGFFNDSGAVNW